jgi:hypothetical protein
MQEVTPFAVKYIIWGYNKNERKTGDGMNRKKFIIQDLTPIFLLAMTLMLPFLSCDAKGMHWNKKDIRKYFSDEKVVNLILAACKGDVKKIDELIAHGADVNSKGKDNITPLYAVFSSLNLKGFQRLLERGANPNVMTSDGDSVMWLVAMGGDISEETYPMLQLCLQHGGDPNWTTPKKDPIDYLAPQDGMPLICSVLIYNEKPIEVLKLLLDAGADIDAKDIRGETALFHCLPDNYDVAYFLLKKGADYAIKDISGNTFAYAIEQCPVGSFKGDKEIAEQKQWRKKVIEFLKEKGIEVHLKYPD